MSKGDIQVGAIVAIDVTIKNEDGDARDISMATSKKILLHSPSGASKECVAQWTTNGADGRMFYKTKKEDLDVAGDWGRQAVFVVGGEEILSDVQTFPVKSNL